MKVKQNKRNLFYLFVIGIILFVSFNIDTNIGEFNGNRESRIKSSDSTCIIRPIGNIQKEWDSSDFSRIDEEIPDNELNIDYGSGTKLSEDIYYFDISDIKLYSITINVYVNFQVFHHGGTQLDIKFGLGDCAEEWSIAKTILPSATGWVSLTWDGLYYIVSNLQISLLASFMDVEDSSISVDTLYAEVTYLDMISEKYRPTENFQNQWMTSDFSMINDDVVAPNIPDGTVNWHEGISEFFVEDIYNFGIRGVRIYSIALYIYASCDIFSGDYAKLSARFRYGESSGWSSLQTIEDPFGPAWVTFHWTGIGQVAENLQIALIADISAQGLGGYVSVDAVYLEIIYIDDDLSNVDDIDAEMVWGGYNGAATVSDPVKAGKNVKVCVLDTGINYNHPAFADTYQGGIDYVDGPDDDDGPYDYDDDGHGTKACGIIAAGDDGMGNIGVAPKISLYVVRIYPLFYPYLPLIFGILWAISNNMDVIYINAQIEVPGPLLYDVCLNAYNQGIVIVAPTGNIDAVSEIAYPAKYSFVICVGAIKKDDMGYSWADLIPTGPALDVVAIDNGYTTDISGGYIHTGRGTSFTGPYVAGVCALILAQNPEFTPAQVKEVLINTCKDQICAEDPAGWDDHFGYGLVNAYGACDQELPNVIITSPSSPIYVGNTWCCASASDNYRVDSVQFKVDYGSWNDASYNPASELWKWEWSAQVGGHTLYCRAYDARGNYQETSRYIIVKSGYGCPILSVFNGEEYVEEGLLNIHNIDGIDIVYHHECVTFPAAVNHRYLFRLVEHPKTISYIDRVELWGELRNGHMMKLPLLSAVHSEKGQVKYLLLISDDKKVEELGADHNNGLSQSIDLEFTAPRTIAFNRFVFIIEGNNAFEK